MPVTAKLSRKFYERLGDDIASELVDWFNAVDLTYQTQLKEMNDLNWERFRATLLAETASIRGKLIASASILNLAYGCTGCTSITGTDGGKTNGVRTLPLGSMPAMFVLPDPTYGEGRPCRRTS